MGYSFDQRGRLACDVCGQAEGKTRKRKCPHGYCPAVAACPGCFKTIKADGRWTKAHATCAASAAEYDAREAKQAAVLNAGGFVRRSAMGFSGDTGELVRVIFSNKDRQEVGFNMAPETYRAFPLLEVLTPDDFRARGPIYEAPATFDDLYARRGGE